MQLNALTVDLEEWFQGLTSTNPQVALWPSLESRVVGATERLLEILRSRQSQATFFVLGYVADRHPALIKRIQSEGHEIGIHGYFHRFVHRLTPATFAAELERSVESVGHLTGERPLGHRAPYFSINGSSSWAFDVLAAQGFRYDSSVFPARSLLYGYPEAPSIPYRLAGTGLIEFPISTLRLAGRNWPAGGGFYLRSMPYPVTRWAIKRLNRQGLPAILYLHPWELDLGQRASVKQKVTARERISHYYGRASLANKLHRLLGEFRFGPLRALVESSWSESEIAQ